MVVRIPLQCLSIDSLVMNFNTDRQLMTNKWFYLVHHLDIFVKIAIELYRIESFQSP